MRAMTVIPGDPGSAEIESRPEPVAADGGVLVAGRLLGVCGTDREIAVDGYGEAPEGETRLLIGHESLGEVLEAPLWLPRLPAVLVNPGVPTATRDVFRAFAGMRGEATPLGEVPCKALVDFLHAHGNDLTPAAIACVPVIGEVLDVLAALPGARLSRMSGSGSTCFALFESAAAASASAQTLGRAYPDWWVAATSLG